MTTGNPFATTPAAEALARPRTAAPLRPARRGLVFWIVRYLPAEIAGTAAMIMAGLVVTTWTDAPAAIGLAALLGGMVGFYVVLAVTIYAEQTESAATFGSAVTRTGLLLLAVVGTAELLDVLLIRPIALIVGVWLAPDPLWGLLGGKLVADVIFYSLAAGAVTATQRRIPLAESRRSRRGAHARVQKRGRGQNRGSVR